MNELLMKIYREVVQYENYSIELGKVLDEEANELLVPYKEKFDADDLETIRTLMYDLSYTAEEKGFCLGVKTVIQILMEVFVN